MKQTERAMRVMVARTPRRMNVVVSETLEKNPVVEVGCGSN